MMAGESFGFFWRSKSVRILANSPIASRKDSPWSRPRSRSVRVRELRGVRRLVPDDALVGTDDIKLRLKDGETVGLTLHTIDGTIPQLRRALDRSLDAFFEFLPGATDEDKRDFDDS